MQGGIALTRGQEARLVNPVQKLRRAGPSRHPGRPFFGYFLLWKNAPAFSTFTTSMWFGEAKESIAVVGPRTDIKTNRRDSDTNTT